MTLEAVTARVDVLAENIRRVDQTLIGVDSKVDGIGTALVVLARLEERHASTQDRLVELAKTTDGNATRLANIEKVMPGLVEMRGWVVLGILAGLGMMGVGLFKLIGLA